MNQQKSRDFIQNILITGLFVLAVLLFARTQMYSLGVDSRSFRPSSAPSSNSTATAASALSAPVRVVVTGTYGRHGMLNLSTAAESFDNPLGRRLAEALGSAQGFAPCTEAEFLTALGTPSIYYDFLESLPLPVLSRFAGGGEEVPENVPARRLTISGQDDGTAALYLWNSPSECYRCTTALTVESVEEVVGQYELGGAYFALDLGLETVEACSLLLEEAPFLPVLETGDPLSDTDWLLSALGFNPRTRTRYLDTAGTEIILDGDRSLRILADKTVQYQGGYQPVFWIEAEDEMPTLQEAVSGAAAFLNQLAGSVFGDATLYLQSVQQNGTATVLLFGYQVEGVPVYIAGGSAAELTLDGTGVTALTLRLRSYTKTDEASMLLPLRQALAVAESRPGTEISIAYIDRPSDCKANWVAA